jgi:hypothetical protein
MKMEATHTSKTSVLTRPTQLHIPGNAFFTVKDKFHQKYLTVMTKCWKELHTLTCIYLVTKLDSPTTCTIWRCYSSANVNTAMWTQEYLTLLIFLLLFIITDSACNICKTTIARVNLLHTSIIIHSLLHRIYLKITCAV